MGFRRSRSAIILLHRQVDIHNPRSVGRIVAHVHNGSIDKECFLAPFQRLVSIFADVYGSTPVLIHLRLGNFHLFKCFCSPVNSSRAPTLMNMAKTVKARPAPRDSSQQVITAYFFTRVCFI